VLAAYPEARVVTNAKCKALLLDALPIAPERTVEVQDGETLALGGRTLEFLLTPWVHWPDTMCTRLQEEEILFTCDFMGSHLATSDLFATDEARVLEAAKRYYAEIMAPFRAPIQKHLDRIGRLGLAMIAPSHGPIHARPEVILDAYRRWASDTPGGTVVIPHVSMYESTARMVACLTDRLVERGLSVQPHNAVGGDLGEFATALVDASAIVFASPTVLGGPHPSIVSLAYLTNALRPKARFAAVIGSYGWGGKVAETLQSMLTGAKVEFLEPVLVKGLPREKDLEALARLAEQIHQRCQGAATNPAA
jgi:flavorubredoxin